MGYYQIKYSFFAYVHRRHGAGLQIRADQQPVLAEGADDGQLANGLMNAGKQGQRGEQIVQFGFHNQFGFCCRDFDDSRCHTAVCHGQ